MAKVQAPAKKTSAPVATVKKTGLSLLDQISRASMVVQDADNIDWVQRAGGGGRGASPENQAIRDKANTLKIGQGFQIPKGLVIVRPITNKSTGVTSNLYTFKGANLVHRLEGKKFRTRRDTQGNLYLFRVTPPQHVEVAGEEVAEE